MSPEPVPEQPPAPATGSAAPARHRTTSVVVGAAAAAWDRLTPPRDRMGLREVAVGMVFEVEDAAAELLARTRRTPTRPRQRPALRLAVLLDRTRKGVVRLAERGAVEEDLGRRRAAVAVDSLVRAVATAAVVERVVDAQVDRLLRPLVITVLDDVLAQLENEPERVQALIRGQRDSMVNELVGRLRQSAAAGDTAVDRVTAKLIRRSASAPAPAPG
ncbi:MAG: hypothetical protein AUI14_08815 [Actinobacteria bacterium 13_2_20CM_2_71_6]|nr:MAG: hypothetical protein AUI14_08815 [Actinobacteria bacterium 13_2_20CM_2_71_6]